MTSYNGFRKLPISFLEKLKDLFELRDQKYSGDRPLKENLLNIFGNLKSGFWHLLRVVKTKPKFRFSEEV